MYVVPEMIYIQNSCNLGSFEPWIHCGGPATNWDAWDLFVVILSTLLLRLLLCLDLAVCILLLSMDLGG